MREILKKINEEEQRKRMSGRDRGEEYVRRGEE